MTSKDPKIRYAIFDVDDVVIDTDEACSLGERSIVEPLRADLGYDKARAVADAFSAAYDELRQQLRRPIGLEAPSFRTLLSRIASWQKGVLSAGHELKLWSRDTLLAVAFEDVGVEVTRTRLESASDHYWQVMTERTTLHGDAAEIVSVLRRRGIRIHLATNSDGFLRYHDEARTFLYDPDHAKRRKLDRLGVIRGIGLEEKDVTVGDPIGKPNPAFYENVLADFSAKLGGEAIARAAVLAVGDSLTSDVVPFLEAGVARGAWLVRSPGTLPMHRAHPGVTVVGSLRDLESILD